MVRPSPVVVVERGIDVEVDPRSAVVRRTAHQHVEFLDPAARQVAGDAPVLPEQQVRVGGGDAHERSEVAAVVAGPVEFVVQPLPPEALVAEEPVDLAPRPVGEVREAQASAYGQPERQHVRQRSRGPQRAGARAPGGREGQYGLVRAGRPAQEGGDRGDDERALARTGAEPGRP